MKTTEGIKWLVLLAITVVLATGVAAWGDDAGTASMTFLKIEPCGRPTSMGGAYAALAADVNALYYNPGGLGMVRQGEIALMHNEYLEDVNHEYLGFVYPGFHNGTIGMDVTYVDLGSFQRTTIGAGNTPVLGGSFDASDMALKVAYGRPWTREVSWGLGVKYMRETLDSVDAQGWAVDMGLMWRPQVYPGLSFGLSLLNLGPKVSYLNTKERLPLQWRGGVAYAWQTLPITLSLETRKSIDSDWGWSVGGEYLFNNVFAVRVGHDSLMDAGSGFNCGVGFKLDAFSVDYAYEPTDDLGDIHRLTLNVKFGEEVEPVPMNVYRPRVAQQPQYQPPPQQQQPASVQYQRQQQTPPPPQPNSQVYYQPAPTSAPIYVAPPPAQRNY